MPIWQTCTVEVHYTLLNISQTINASNWKSFPIPLAAFLAGSVYVLYTDGKNSLRVNLSTTSDNITNNILTINVIPDPGNSVDLGNGFFPPPIQDNLSESSPDVYMLNLVFDVDLTCSNGLVGNCAWCTITTSIPSSVNIGVFTISDDKTGSTLAKTMISPNTQLQPGSYLVVRSNLFPPNPPIIFSTNA